jgi:outer membrane protein assembly factor BamA
VVYEVERPRRDNDIILPRLVYSSKQNWTLGADASLGTHDDKVRFGMLTDNDQLLERYSGIRGGYEHDFNDRVSVAFAAESVHTQWNGAVETALAKQPEGNPDNIPGTYRSRLNLQPTITIALIAPLTLTVGVSVQRLENQLPAARTETSNAWVTSLRLQRRWETSVVDKQYVEAGYHLRAATTGLSSDFSYTRHSFEGYYRWTHRDDAESIILSFTAGVLDGRAPLFERFVLGNSTTLRGWNKYDVAPLGGNRMAHGSLEFRRSLFRVFYDTGAVWDSSITGSSSAKVRHSIGAGLASGHSREALTLAVAFPLRQGHMEPMFLLGMNF